MQNESQERGSKRGQIEKKKTCSNARHLIRILLVILRIRSVRVVRIIDGYGGVVIRDA